MNDKQNELPDPRERQQNKDPEKQGYNPTDQHHNDPSIGSSRKKEIRGPSRNRQSARLLFLLFHWSSQRPLVNAGWRSALWPSHEVNEI
jgi:hypothetical protein